MPASPAEKTSAAHRPDKATTDPARPSTNIAHYAS